MQWRESCKNFISTETSSQTAIACEQAALFGATPGPDEFDNREIWNEEEALGRYRGSHPHPNGQPETGFRDNRPPQGRILSRRQGRAGEGGDAPYRKRR